jgi:hypothetical protein
LAANVLPTAQRGRLSHPELLLGSDVPLRSQTMTHQGSDENLRCAVRKGQMTNSACQQCRKRKIKVMSPRKQQRSGYDTVTGKADSFHQQCSGERPACAGCVRREKLCMYDIEEGTTRLQNLRKRLGSAQIELTEAKNFIYSLRYSSDADAVGLLVRLRMGEDITELASAEPLRSEWCVCSRIVYQSGHVKLTANKGCQSQNMLTVLIYRYNILSPTLWKLEHHISTYRFNDLATNPSARILYNLICSINPYHSVPDIHSLDCGRTVDT